MHHLIVHREVKALAEGHVAGGWGAESNPGSVPGEVVLHLSTFLWDQDFVATAPCEQSL